jgi:hypothetical protein
MSLGACHSSVQRRCLAVPIPFWVTHLLSGSERIRGRPRSRFVDRPVCEGGSRSPGRSSRRPGQPEPGSTAVLGTDASRIVSRRTASSAGSPPAGRTRRSGQPDPAALRQRHAKPRAGRRRGAKVHSAGATLGTAQHVEADVGRDGIQPRPQRRSVLVEPIQPPPGTYQGLLHGVLCLERRAQHPIAVADQLDPDLLQPGIHPQRLARGRVTGAICSRARSHPTSISYWRRPRPGGRPLALHRQLLDGVRFRDQRPRRPATVEPGLGTSTGYSARRAVAARVRPAQPAGTRAPSTASATPAAPSPTRSTGP